MSKSLASAAEHLKQARDHLSLVKAQYQSAEATYEVQIPYMKLLNLLKPFAQGLTPNTLNSANPAKPSQFETSFNNSRHPDHIAENEGQSERLHARLTPRDTAIYFASDPDGKTWYTKAGVETDLPACPFVWLLTGPPTVTGQPHICVSFEPAPGSDEDAGRSSKGVYPRQKGALEAFNGSVNYDLVNSWLWKCCTEDAASILTLDIYLVDVQTKSFVRRRAGDRFVALSYVWGKKGQKTASVSVSNDCTLREQDDQGQTNPEFTQELPNIIPQTMVDAMTFVDRIGERYLWIDQLCIDQTNHEEKQRQINAMDQIFASAYLTIVSMDGPDADWG